jgi:hypothetical protein
MDDESLNPDAPYALSDSGEQRRRLELLNQPHMAPLTRYINEIRLKENNNLPIPNFDPCDGGVYASGLFLLDFPDHSAITSGFVSRNNMDYSSRNLCVLMERAGINRRNTLIWNLTPWKITNADELVTDKAFLLLEQLFKLLSNLSAIILIGDHSRSTGLRMKRITKAQIVQSPYPFIGTFNMRNDAKDAVLKTFERVAKILNNETTPDS